MTTGGESYESMLNGLHFERTDKNVNDLSIDIKGGARHLYTRLLR